MRNVRRLSPVSVNVCRPFRRAERFFIGVLNAPHHLRGVIRSMSAAYPQGPVLGMRECSHGLAAQPSTGTGGDSVLTTSAKSAIRQIAMGPRYQDFLFRRHGIDEAGLFLASTTALKPGLNACFKEKHFRWLPNQAPQHFSTKLKQRSICGRVRLFDRPSRFGTTRKLPQLVSRRWG
jgi:hypothetical protein